ncbi:hypothetical protein CSW57_22800 [Williamsia muralis]|uniref:Helix-turn-helix domain-containing protein n=1 Tax=Williamsia marianensis TaxID=85044 RepID=A0A2G3PFP9_WILMA|nr:hypothetical protein CSW57_22800 [Williamsia marianensis]
MCLYTCGSKLVRLHLCPLSGDHIKSRLGVNSVDKLTLKQAAERTGFSVEHLRRLAKSGDLPASRRGKRLIVVDQADLAALDKPL